jgi:hypothetical protein
LIEIVGEIIERCSSRGPAGSKFKVAHYQEFGGLRIYVNYANDAIRQRIEAAIPESFHACEVCGQSGTLREGYWIKTLCDERDTREHASVG